MRLHRARRLADAGASLALRARPARLTVARCWLPAIRYPIGPGFRSDRTAAIHAPACRTGAIRQVHRLRSAEDRADRHWLKRRECAPAANKP
jgi:hypothetical protein